MNARYVSFVGFLVLPSNNQQLEKEYPKIKNYYEPNPLYGEECEEWYDESREIWTTQYVQEKEFRQGLEYQSLDGKDSLTVYLAIIDHKTGHLVADCGGWSTGTFVVLENGRPKKSQNNYNPNPIEQLV